MGLIVFLLLLVAALAIFGVVAEAFGKDSREPLEDDRAGDWTGRII